MLDITTIILTYNEEIHIRRCLENVCQFSKRVIVVDSPSNDRTVEIINEFKKELERQSSTIKRQQSTVNHHPSIEVVVHEYPGNQAEQFNWAIDNLKINTKWVLRLDADEYLLPELVSELEQKLPKIADDVTGIEFRRRHIFMGRWVKHGIYPVIMMRMFRTGCGRYDERLMDEHIVLKEGRSVVFDHDFCDHSLINISDYCRKHINYAQREATEVLSDGLSLTLSRRDGIESHLGVQAQHKHAKKSKYNSLPLFWRSFAYFIYRYFLRGGFLDGKEGFLFAFIQGWWYRTLVDAKVLEVRKWLKDNKLNPNNEDGKNAIREYIRKNWNIKI